MDMDRLVSRIRIDFEKIWLKNWKKNLSKPIKLAKFVELVKNVVLIFLKIFNIFVILFFILRELLIVND